MNNRYIKRLDDFLWERNLTLLKKHGIRTQYITPLIAKAYETANLNVLEKDGVYYQNYNCIFSFLDKLGLATQESCLKILSIDDGNQLKNFAYIINPLNYYNLCLIESLQKQNKDFLDQQLSLVKLCDISEMYHILGRKNLLSVNNINKLISSLTANNITSLVDCLTKKPKLLDDLHKLINFVQNDSDLHLLLDNLEDVSLIMYGTARKAYKYFPKEMAQRIDPRPTPELGSKMLRDSIEFARTGKMLFMIFNRNNEDTVLHDLGKDIVMEIADQLTDPTNDKETENKINLK